MTKKKQRDATVWRPRVRRDDEYPWQKLGWRSVLLADPCVFCGNRAQDLDHIHPKNYGGPDGWANRAPTCKACNMMKADGSLIWMLWRLHEQRRGRFRARIIGFRGNVPIRALKEYGGFLRRPEPYEVPPSLGLNHWIVGR